MSLSVDFINLPQQNMLNEQWRTPLSLAVGLHVLVLLLTLLPPSLFYSRPEIPEVVTINLFTAEELRPTKNASKPKAPKPQPKPVKSKPVTPPPKPKVVTSIAPQPPAPPAAPAKVVSLRPRKIKKIPPTKKVKKPKIADQKRLNALERIKAKVNQQRETERAQHDLASLRDAIHAKKEEPERAPSTTTQESAEQPDSSQAASRGSAELMDKASKRYHVAIFRRIQQHWVLPDMQNWNDSLEALVVIVLNSQGRITKSYFEKESANAYFNQFVEKTIQEAAPMPHFPADLKINKLEIGLRFRPSGMY